MTEIESRYYDKIELLKALNVDIWLKKPKFYKKHKKFRDRYHSKKIRK